MALSFGNGPSQGTNPASVGFASGANAVTLLYVTYYSAGPNFTTTSSITDPGGRIWRCRKRTTLQSLYAGAGSTAGAQYITQEVWWATDTVAHNVIMTLNLANSTGLVQTQWVMQDVNGSLTPSAPWDTHASEPAVMAASSAGGLTAPSVSFTTAQANSLILACLSEETDAAASTLAGAGTGYAAVLSSTPNGTSPNQFHMLLESKATTTAGAQTATTTTTKPAFIFSADALSGTSTGTAAGDTGSDLTILAGTAQATTLPVGASGTLTYTNSAPCVMVMTINTIGTPGFVSVSSVTDSSGVTWHRRSITEFISAFTGFFSVDHLHTEVWWANITAAHASAQTITINLSNSASLGSSPSIGIFGVVGSLVPSTPWDSGGTQKATYGNNSGVATTMSAPFTASSAKAMVFGIGQSIGASGASAPTVGAGYTLIEQDVRGTTNKLVSGSEFKIGTGSGTATWTVDQVSWLQVTDSLTSDSNGNSTDFGASPGVTGTISTALTKASMSLAASEKFTGTIATNLTKVSQSLSQAQNISGTITTRLSKFNLAATDVEVFIGTIRTNLTKINSAGAGASAQEIFVGQIVTRLSPVTMVAVGEEDFIAHVVTRLGSTDGHIAANVVQAEVIVLGPIEMTLPPFRPLILGAKLGTPGIGKWYSWRYSDS